MFERPLLKEMFATELSLSKTNPRFPKPVESEEEAILTFFRLKKVGPKKIESLILDIIETGAVLEDFIVLQKDNEFIVYDGNRRLTALKLLMDDTVEIIKELYPSTYRFIHKVKSEINPKTLVLNTKIYTDTSSMANHVAKIHSGEQEGVGPLKWESNEKNTFAAQFFNKPINTGNLIYKKVEISPNRKGLYNRIKDQSLATTFDRIFTFADIRSRIFNLDRGIKVDIDNEDHFNKVCEMIEYFLDENATVADVYTAELTSAFFAHILPVRSAENSDPSSDSSSTGDNVDPKSDDGDTQDPDSITEDNKDQKDNGDKNSEDPDNTNNSEGSKYDLNLTLKNNKITVHLYNDYDLMELVEFATDTYGENLIGYVSFKSENNLIRQNIFSGDASQGTYYVQAKLEYNNFVVSKAIEINVTLPKKKIKVTPPKNEFFQSLPAFTEGEVTININATVDMLIKEIQSLENAHNFRYMISSSVRQLLEISIDKVIKDKHLTNHGNTKQNLKYLVETHLTNAGLLTQICNGENRLKFQATKNFLNSIESEKLYDYLNLITHDSSSSIYDELVERVNLRITPLLVVFHNYLHLNRP